MWYNIIYGILIFAGLAMTVREGLWSNVLLLINIIVSGLVAFGFYSKLVVYLDEEVTNGQHTYWLDFAVIWGLYFIAMVVCRVLTGAVSKTRMRFKNPIDPVGGPIVGLMAAWVLAAFTLATFHTAPLPKDMLGGAFVRSDSDISGANSLMNPDLGWLRFFAATTSDTSLGFSKSDKTDQAVKGFVKNYEAHRAAFDKSDKLIVARTKKG
jgi:uncharacterized membrane protein required for colicin V production